MGTRAVIRFHDEEQKRILSLWCQYDGYPSGIGKDLKDMLSGTYMANGILVGDDRLILGGYEELPIYVITMLKRKQYLSHKEMETVTGVKREGPEGYARGNFYLYVLDDDYDGYTYDLFPTLKMESLGHAVSCPITMVVSYDHYTYYHGNVLGFNPEDVEERVEERMEQQWEAEHEAKRDAT